MSKIALLQEKCWLIRSLDGRGPPLFHEAANQWNRSPAHATIYRSEEVAQRAIDDMRFHRRAGFSIQIIVEAVPMSGALLALGRPV